MERLSINDPPVGPQHGNNALQGSMGPPPPLGPMVPPQGPPQLPPQMFTTAAQLLDLTDKKLVLVLRDGRKLIGVLRSWDQFANLVLQDTIERLYAGNLYADIRKGIFVVRGENVLLLGEIDLDKEDEIPSTIQKAPFEEVLELKKKEDNERKHADKKGHDKLQELGFEAEHSGGKMETIAAVAALEQLAASPPNTLQYDRG